MKKLELRNICDVVEHLQEQSEILDGLTEMLRLMAAHSRDIPESPDMGDSWTWVPHDLSNKAWRMKTQLAALEKALYRQLKVSNPRTSADLKEGGGRT